MTPEQERAFEVKAEKMLVGHRELPCGRDFRCFTYRFRDEGADFKKRYDDTFPGCPGSDEWFRKRFEDA